MNITVVAVGKKRTEHFESALQEYKKRLTRWVAVDWHIVPATDKDTESHQLERIVDNAGPHAICVLLDERGAMWSTPELADKLAGWQNNSVKQVLFIIGGAHGVSDVLRSKMNDVWSLSSLVFPHELVRVLLMEQLYRAYDINAGGKYHHA